MGACLNISSRQPIHHHIKAREWNEVNESISTLSTVIDDNFTRSSIKIDFSGKTILHHVCCMRPPLETVKKIVVAYPGLVRGVDFSKRLPLHYAIEMGASPQVVKYLLSIDKDTVLHRDSKGRTPLRLAFNGNSEYWCDTGNEAGDIIEGPLYEVVEALCLAGPSAIVLEDNTGVSALERAIIIDTKHNFIKLMQRESMWNWQKGDRRFSRICDDHKFPQGRTGIDKSMKKKNVIYHDNLPKQKTENLNKSQIFDSRRQRTRLKSLSGNPAA